MAATENSTRHPSEARSVIVSVIVPVYNRPRLLSEAIGSVVSQTYPHWELLVVDDGSTEPLDGVVQAFDDDRIRYIWQLNQGVSVARNRGILSARGKYVAFLDSDDFWEPTYLENKMAFMRSFPRSTLLGGGCRYVDATGRPVLPPGAPRQTVTALDLSIWTAFPGGSSHIFCPKEALISVGGFDPRLSDSEDRLLMRHLAEVGEVHFVQAHDVVIRVHGEPRNRRDLRSVVYSRWLVTESISDRNLRRRSRAWDLFVLGKLFWSARKRISAIGYWFSSFASHQRRVHPELQRVVPILDLFAPKWMGVLRGARDQLTARRDPES